MSTLEVTLNKYKNKDMTFIFRVLSSLLVSQVCSVEGGSAGVEFIESNLSSLRFVVVCLVDDTRSCDDLYVNLHRYTDSQYTDTTRGKVRLV